ncbi:hypothetical protein FIBSPDRAFT_1045664, partial [Athelia psychrophila]
MSTLPSAPTIPVSTLGRLNSLSGSHLLQINLELKTSDEPYYLPGQQVKGWIRCCSPCLLPGSKATLTSVRVGLVGEQFPFLNLTRELKGSLVRRLGECYASVPTKDSAVDLSDMDEIFQQSVEVYDSDEPTGDSQARGPFGGLVGSFVKFPFTLQLPDECSDTVAGGNGTANVPLPPSLLRNGGGYIEYFISAVGLPTLDGPPYLVERKIIVLPYEKRSLPLKYAWPRVISQVPYTIVSAPLCDETPATKVVWLYVPLSAVTCPRSRCFDGKVIPLKRDKKIDLADPTFANAICNGCTGWIPGDEARFLCCDCLSDFDWCQRCMANPEKTHPTEHKFVRIEAERMGQVSYAEMNTAAKTAASLVASVSEPPVTNAVWGLKDLVSRCWQKWFPSFSAPQTIPKSSAKLPREKFKPLPARAETSANVVIEITADVLYEVHIPDPESYPRTLSTPIFAIIHLRGPSLASLADLRPILPWDTLADRKVDDGTRGPVVSLEVCTDSLVEGRTHTEANSPVVWSTMGGWYPPGMPHSDETQWMCSQNWSEPVKEHYSLSTAHKSSAVRWKQTAVVCSWLNKQKSGLRDVCHVDVRLLKTRHELVLRHGAGGRFISLPLSTRPWTSGIFRDTSESISTTNAAASSSRGSQFDP